MSSWEFHQRMRVQRSRAMAALLRKAVHRLRDAWRHGSAALNLREVG